MVREPRGSRLSTKFDNWLVTPAGGVRWAKKFVKMFAFKSYQNISCLHNISCLTFQCPETRSDLQSTRWCEQSKKLPQIFSQKITPTTTFLKVHYDLFSKNQILLVLSLIIRYFLNRMYHKLWSIMLLICLSRYNS